MTNLVSRVHGAIVGALVSDAYALGFHWVYDTSKVDISKQVNGLIAPESPYQASKNKGEFTHYGDQTFALLKSVSGDSNKKYSVEKFFQIWRALFEDKSYNGYYDHATKDTFSNVEKIEKDNGTLDYEKIGSASGDFSGAGRFSPIFLRLLKDENVDEEELVKDCLSQTKLTHNNSAVLQTTDLFSRATLKVIQGDGKVNPIDAIKAVLAANKNNYNEIHDLVNKGLGQLETSKDDSITSVGKENGQPCPWNCCLPNVIVLIGRYGDNLEETLKHNSLIGGETAARALVIGTLLGAYHGKDKLPKFVSQMKEYENISKLLEQ